MPKIIEEAFSNARRDVFEGSNGERFLHSTDRTVRITVSGRGEFPFDQLRRYPSYPTDTDSAFLLGSDERYAREVSLYLVGDRIDEPTVQACAARYASFGWTVNACEVTY